MIYTIFIHYFLYWYTKGFVALLKYLKAYIQILTDTFSVKVSLLTWFSPWKRDVGNMDGLPLDKKLGVIVFNVISRFFGAFIKTVTLAAYLVILTLLVVLSLSAIMLWLSLPLVFIFGIVFGLLILITPNA